jgi:tetratricopeptide (TPR) repeat protein
LKIKRDFELNKAFIRPEYLQHKMAAVWHYKSILYTYQLNMESSGYYYEKLKSTPYFPLNNYATFCSIQAKFREASGYYEQSKSEDRSDKRLNESYYYLSVMDAYKNDNKKSIEAMKSLIKANGSTPGFGWYNLSLTRNYLYDGQLDQAKRHAASAAQFKEIHIGTTLGQSHYDFTTSLMNLLIKIKEIEQVKFQNKNWWYTPSDISKIARLTVEKYGLQFLIINQFAENPERDRVIYKLFSTESTVSFDEIGQLLEGFSTNYFLERFKKEITNDKRYQVKRYYRWMVAKLLMKQGNYREAQNQLNSILNELQIDEEYEKLLLGRVYEALAHCAIELDENSKAEAHFRSLYDIYPQLIPYSGLKVPMFLQTNASTPDQQKIITGLKEKSIAWVATPAQTAPQASIQFTRKGSLPIIRYEVRVNGKVVVPAAEIAYQNNAKISDQLALHLFGVGAALEQEKQDDVSLR